jgi:flavin reductase (DIM6/NTAB) family NADH-FMN oxidoreductase RutF
MPDTPTIQPVDLQWAYRFLGFGPLVLVSTTDGQTPDVSAVAWCAPCDKVPPTFMLSIGDSHRTYRNLKQTGFFGINVPTVSNADLVMYTGTVSGNDVDKVAEGNIGLWYGRHFGTLPLVSDCAAWLECKCLPTVDVGDSQIIVGQAVAAYCRPGVLLPDHSWNTAEFPTLHHLGGRNFLVGRERMVAEPARK